MEKYQVIQKQTGGDNKAGANETYAYAMLTRPKKAKTAVHGC